MNNSVKKTNKPHAGENIVTMRLCVLNAERNEMRLHYIVFDDAAVGRNQKIHIKRLSILC